MGERRPGKKRALEPAIHQQVALVAQWSTKDHVAVDGNSVSLACVTTAADVNDMLVFEPFFLAPIAVMGAFGRCSRTEGTMPSRIARCAARLAPSPGSTREASRPARSWASDAGQSSAAPPGCSRTNAWRSAMTGSTLSFSHCFKRPASSWLQDASPENSENRLLGLQ
jgi:hypothetical protein